jgi:hypothetical protein
MSKLKNSLIAFAGLMLLAGIAAVLPPGVRQVQGSDDKKAPACEPRRFYLTPLVHDGSAALTARAEGYHMASLWEIHDPSNLRYDTALGFTRDDSGFGPPIGIGWVRTGGNLGAANCDAWTNGTTGSGVTVSLNSEWSGGEATPISPWFASSHSCSLPQRVWCVQD